LKVVYCILYIGYYMLDIVYLILDIEYCGFEMGEYGC